MPSLSTRTNTFTESLIRKMTRISLENNAINLSQGFPDFDPPKVLMDRLAAVSYTHLDVYKRQVLSFLDLLFLITLLAADRIFFVER